MVAIYSPQATLAWSRSRPGPTPLVVVSGVFDWLHPGNLWALTLAHRLGGELLVVVEPDDVAASHAGAGRPRNALETRVELVAGLRDVSVVTSVPLEALPGFAAALGAFTYGLTAGRAPGNPYTRAWAAAAPVEPIPVLGGCFSADILAAMREGRTPLALPAAWTRLERDSSAGERSATGRNVTANGCFDILHVGHLRFLAAARARGDALTVLINDDASVARYKGPTRPVFPAVFRAAALRALACVDRVVVFPGDTPLPELAQLRPHIHVKGGSYEPDRVREERALLESWGGRLDHTPLVEGFSTTDQIRKALTV